MEGKTRLLAVALLMAVVSGCSHEPPEYESRYTPPTSAPPPPPSSPPGASFVDDFERPDTDIGLDDGWEMRAGDAGKPTAPVQTGAFLRDGHYVSSDDSDVYAVRTLRGNVRRVGAEGRWTEIGDGGYESLIMGVAADDSLNSHRLQVAVSPAGWELLMTPDSGAPKAVAKETFNPPLVLNGTYRFEMDVDDGWVTVRVGGIEKKVELDTAKLLGERAYWQHFSPKAQLPIGAKFCIDMVWAAEQGEPLSPVPTE